VITGENSNANHLLAIVGAFAVMAASIYFVLPAKTMTTIAETAGLEDRILGPVPKEAAADKTADARPAPVKGEARHPSEPAMTLSSYFHARRSRTAHTGDAKTPDTVPPDIRWRPVIKTTTRERGHLIERYLFRNGGIVVLVDGRVVLVS